MGKTCKFYDTTRSILQERLELLRKETTPPWTDIRHFFYNCRFTFLAKYKDLEEPDSESKTLYADWQGNCMGNWLKDHCEEFDIPPELYWRLREKLNIWPEGKATCEGRADKFLIEKKTRGKVTSGVSFILICEKKTISRELLEVLQGEGYKLNIVSTGGHSPSDVQEVVLQIAEEMSENEDATFYILVLHDFDRDGIHIYFTLKERYPGVIDIGLNQEFIQYLISLGDFELRLVQEKVLNRNYRTELEKKIKKSDEYSMEDFDFIQGEAFETIIRGKPKTYYHGKRIELDLIHTQYGIQPFIDYTMKKILKECKIWDLKRIGVTPFSLSEPKNHYKSLINKFEESVGRAYGKKLGKISTPLNDILKIVKDTITQPPEYSELVDEHLASKVRRTFTVTDMGTGEGYNYRIQDVKGVSEITKEYDEQMSRKWIEDYEDDLEEINEQIPHYEGDVRKGADDLNDQTNELQENLDKEKKHDPDLEPFDRKLWDIDWGEDELKKIEEPKLSTQIKRVMDALEEKLKEIDEEDEEVN